MTRTKDSEPNSQLSSTRSQENLYTFLQTDNYKHHLPSSPSNNMDAVNDPDFLAYLAAFPFSTPVNSVSHTILSPPYSFSPTLFLPLLPTVRPLKSTNKKNVSSVSKLGHCEHPKHVAYRQERYTLASSESESSFLKTIPRRGRPPKGSKPMNQSESAKEKQNYRLVALTVRPLPKRLEPVVGKSNIKVCLTCLKKSDTDPEYLSSKNYVGPQPVFKRRKNIMKQ